MVKYYIIGPSIHVLGILNCELQIDAVADVTFNRPKQMQQSDQIEVRCRYTEKSFHLSLRCAVRSGRIQRAVPCNFHEGLCSCPPIAVEPQTAGKSGRPESPAESISKN